VRILLTGPTGVLGPETIRTLAGAGHAVSVLARSPLPKDLAALTFGVHAGDVTIAADVERAVRGADVVVHLAALLHASPEDQFTEVQYMRTNAEGTAHVVRAAERSGVSRVVLASTIAIYGDAPPGVVTESSAPHPETPYARSKVAAEQLMTEFGRRGGLPVVLRISAVYGPRMKGAYRRLVSALNRGRFVPPGAGSNRRSLVHEIDAASAIAAAATHPAAGGRVFNVANPTSCTTRQIVRAICEALGRRPPVFFLPRHLALGAAGIAEIAGYLSGHSPPATRSMVNKYNQEIVVDASAIERMLGVSTEMTLQAGWNETIAALRASASL
jgi:UDP-glucose 4-epimerase